MELTDISPTRLHCARSYCPSESAEWRRPSGVILSRMPRPPHARSVHRTLHPRIARLRHVPGQTMNEDINTLRRILKPSPPIAGLACRPTGGGRATSPPSTCKEHGYRSTTPVNPADPEVLGEKVLPELARPSPEQVDIVDCFRKSDEIPQIAEEAVAIGARGSWMQIGGATNHEAADRARKAGLEVVMDRCVKIEHARLFGGLNWVGAQHQGHLSQRPHWLAY